MRIVEGSLKRETSLMGQKITFVTKDVQEADRFFARAVNKPVTVEFKTIKEKRSLNANGLFWHCVQELASALMTSKDEIYLQLLKRYGKFTYVCVKPSMVEAVKKQWRETEVIGEVEINGQKATQLLCYFGSSTYDTKEFSKLLDGTISEMRDLDLEVPGDEQINQLMKEYGTE